MTDSESVSRYRKAIHDLASGDIVTPVEELRVQTRAVIEAVAEASPAGSEDEPTAPIANPLEEFLALGLPLLDHGAERGPAVVVAELQALGFDEGDRQRPPNELLRMLALHHLVWPMTAFAVSHERTELLASLARVLIVDRFEDSPSAVFETTSVRHLDAFNREAGRSFESVRNWFGSRSVRRELPRFASDEELDAALGEADLIAALCLAKHVAPERPIYCHARQDPTVLRRLNAHAVGPRRADIAAVLDVPPADVQARLEELLGQVTGGSPW